MLRSLGLITLFASALFAQQAPSTPAQPAERITVVRSGCEGDCPAYTVQLDADGTVTYEGQGFVKTYGKRIWKVPEIGTKKVFAQAEASELVPGNQSTLLTSKGNCTPLDGTPKQPLVHVALTVRGYNEFPAATCYGQGVAEIAKAMDELTGASIYALGRDTAAEAAIRAVLDAQVEAWNRDNLEGYMSGYWRSPELTFFSGASETTGWQPTLERYRKSYKSQGKEMGKLTFGEVRIEMLSPDGAFVRGEWKLKMSNGATPHGTFTLIMRKMPDGWRIIHDHSSGA